MKTAQFKRISITVLCFRCKIWDTFYVNQISTRLIESVKFEGLSQVQATKCSMGLNAKKNKLF